MLNDAIKKELVGYIETLDADKFGALLKECLLETTSDATGKEVSVVGYAMSQLQAFKSTIKQADLEAMQPLFDAMDAAIKTAFATFSIDELEITEHYITATEGNNRDLVNITNQLISRLEDDARSRIVNGIIPRFGDKNAAEIVWARYQKTSSQEDLALLKDILEAGGLIRQADKEIGLDDLMATGVFNTDAGAGAAADAASAGGAAAAAATAGKKQLTPVQALRSQFRKAIRAGNIDALNIALEKLVRLSEDEQQRVINGEPGSKFSTLFEMTLNRYATAYAEENDANKAIYFQMAELLSAVGGYALEKDGITKIYFTDVFQPRPSDADASAAAPEADGKAEAVEPAAGAAGAAAASSSSAGRGLKRDRSPSPDRPRSPELVNNDAEQQTAEAGSTSRLQHLTADRSAPPKRRRAPTRRSAAARRAALTGASDTGSSAAAVTPALDAATASAPTLAQSARPKAAAPKRPINPAAAALAQAARARRATLRPAAKRPQ